MGNILTPFKRFLSNKNTVTILGVLLGIVVLYVGYNMRVKDAINPVSVPYAKQEIGPRTQITEDMVGFTDVPSSMLKNNANLIQNSQDVIDKWTTLSTTIPENSLFYKSAIVPEQALPDSALEGLAENDRILAIPISTEVSTVNIFAPGNYIDLFLKAVDDDGKVIFGEFIKSIQIRQVVDNEGNDVFQSTDAGDPEDLLFAVPIDLFYLLNRAKFITSNSIEIIPVPRGRSYSANPSETEVSSEYLYSFIQRKVAIIPDQDTNN